jgi:hypothetical protein
MKKKYSFYIILLFLVFSSCIKAYDPSVIAPVKANTPYAITDVAGVYKGGSLVTVKALLDSASYTTIDDSCSISLTNYYKDTILVSIITSSPVTYKRYKLGLLDSVNTSEASVFRFQKILLDSSYYLYNKVFNLEVTLYFPNILKKSTAVISNNSIAANTPNYIYTESEAFNGFLQPK